MTYMYHNGSEETTSAVSGFEKLLEELQAGDCMVVERFSGVAKDGASLLAMLERLETRGIRFRSVEENFDTGSEQGRFALDILKSVAQLDEQARKEKQPEATVKEDVRSKGRKPIEVDEEMFDSILERWKNGEITARQAMAELDLKPNTFYRRVKERMPDSKSTDALLDAAKKFGKEIVNTVTESSEEIQQAAGKFAAEHDMSTISDTVKKNVTAAGLVFSRHIDSLSKDFQDAVEKFEKKQRTADNPDAPVEQEEHIAAEEPTTEEGPITAEEPITEEGPITAEEPIASAEPVPEAEAPEADITEEAVPQTEETEYL